MNTAPPTRWRRFRANRPAMFGLGIVALLLAFTCLAPVLIPYDPNVSDFALPRSAIGGPPAPSFAHPLGADPLFRDVLARLGAGARLSLGVALSATVVALFLGTIVGVVAGFCEGTRLRVVDGALTWLLDLALAFPYLLLVTAIGVAVDRAGPATIALILGVTSWVGMARLVRARTLEIKRRDYILAARALGVRESAIVGRHVLASLRGTLLVLGSQAVGQLVLAEAVLGYLTVGVGPPQASFGRMLQEAEHYLGAQPLLVGAPAFAIVLTVFGFTRVADGLGDALAEKSLRSRSPFPADALVLGGLLCVLVGFSGAAALDAPLAASPHGGEVLRLASSTTIGSLDPSLISDETGLAVDELVHARLLGRNEKGELVGELAERFVIENGGTRVRVVLRQGLTFHDGSPLGASDVKRSIERTLHPDTPCPAASEFSAIAGFADFRARRTRHLAGLIIAAELELTVDLAVADAAFPSLLGLGFTAPVCDTGLDHADPTAPPPCGAGPFRLARRHEESLELSRFDGYYLKGLPTVAAVHWSLGVPFRTQLFQFQRGELDVLTELSGIDSQRFTADPRWSPTIKWAGSGAVDGIFLNTEHAPFDNRHVRRAVAFAVDPTVLPRLRPSVAPRDRLLPDGIPRPLDAPHRTHDVTAALEEMRLAGFAFDPSTGRGGYPEPVDYVTVASSLDQSVAEVYQQQLARVGVRIRVKPLAYASFLAAIGTRGACAMGWRSWHPDFPDPAAVLDPTLTRAAISEQGSQNVSFFANPAFDSLATAARREASTDKRMELYAQLEGIVRDEAPWIPTYSSRRIRVWQPYVRGLSTTADGRLDLRAARVEVRTPNNPTVERLP